jgi:ATP/maltotriose-dependent transcriptional regulator MalT
LRIHKEICHPWGIALGIYDLAGLSMIQRDYDTARSSYEACLARLHELGDRELLASCLEGLAAAVIAQGGEKGLVAETFWAARLWGAAEALREAIGAPMHPVQCAAYQQVLALAYRQVSEQALRTAWEEGRLLTPEQALAAQAQAMLPTPTPKSSPAAPPLSSPSFPAGLTAREVEVLRLLAQGLSDRQIAEQLVIARRTVNWYLTSIYSKIGVSSRSAATRYAIEQQLI